MTESAKGVMQLLRQGARKANDFLERSAGMRLVRTDLDPPELVGMEAPARAAVRKAAGRTMTDPLQQYAAYSAARYVCQSSVPGDIVECGVWRGGAAMLGMMDEGQTDRTVWLYDTFEGMTAPGDRDAFLATGLSARQLLAETSRTGDKESDWTYWCVADEGDVRAGVLASGYPSDHVRLVRGPVETTLSTSAPSQVAIARLDNDWYESMGVELEVLFPRISPGGVLIIDDYDDWAGAREAVDEYFTSVRLSPLLVRAGFGRVFVKHH